MGYKILLADDSVTVQKIITLTFSDEGVDVLTVNNGDEAINRLQYMRPALVMADVSIPGKNGYEICEFVKQHPEMKNTPVILLVPAFEPFDEERARRIGADHYLTKPFQSIRTLISTVKNLIDPDEKRRGAPVIAEVKTQPQAGSDVESETTAKSAVAADEPSVIRFSSEKAYLDADSSGDLISLGEPDEEAAVPDVLGVGEHGATGNVIPFGRGASDESDHVLDLDDVLWPAPVAQPVTAVNSSRSIVQTVEVEDERAIGLFPRQAPAPELTPADVDEIVERVVAQLSDRLTENLTETLAERLSRDLARRLAPEVAEIVKQQQLAEKASYREPDALLELDEV